MMKKYLTGSSVVTQEGQNITLEYYLLEEMRDTGGRFLYGMMIRKEERKTGKLERTQTVAKAISYSREYVERMICLFMRNTVTPLTMMELIDEYVSREGLSA